MDTIGTLKEKTYQFFIKNYKNKDEFKKNLRSFKNIMSENKNLANVYNLYSDFETKYIDDKTISEMYVNEAVQEIKKLMDSSFNKGLKEWSKLVGNIKIDGLSKVNESLDKLVYTEGVGTLLERIESKNYLTNQLVTEKTRLNESTKVVNPKLLNVVLVQKFNDKFKDMSEDDRNTFMELNKLKESEIKEQIDTLKESITEKLQSFKDNDDLKGVIEEVNKKMNESKVDRLSLLKLRLLEQDLSD